MNTSTVDLSIQNVYRYTQIHKIQDGYQEMQIQIQRYPLYDHSPVCVVLQQPGEITNSRADNSDNCDNCLKGDNSDNSDNCRDNCENLSVVDI